MKKIETVAALMLTASLATPAASAAGIVSWNFDPGASTIGGQGAGATPPLSAQAGVELAGGWTNSSLGNPTVTDLRNDDGDSTTLDVTSTAFSNGYHVAGELGGDFQGQDSDGTWNSAMLNGYANAGAADPNAPVTTIALGEIPYVAYDIYVYFASDVADREGSVTVADTTYFFRTAGAATVNGEDALLTPTTDEVDNAPDDDGPDDLATYAVFTGLSGETQTMETDIPEFGGISGFQVVQIPEPSAALLGGLGLLGFLRRRRS